MQPYNLTELVNLSRKVTNDIVIYLPRSSDVRQLACQSTEDQSTTVIHYCMEGASKVCHFLFPSLQVTVLMLPMLRQFARILELLIFVKI